jgi:hypothetical protein
MEQVVIIKMASFYDYGAIFCAKTIEKPAK